jgi:hypothetical protein
VDTANHQAGAAERGALTAELFRNWSFGARTDTAGGAGIVRTAAIFFGLGGAAVGAGAVIAALAPPVLIGVGIGIALGAIAVIAVDIYQYKYPTIAYGRPTTLAPTSYENTQRPSKTPNTGEPDSTFVNPQTRTYDSNGKPKRDIDYDHDHDQGTPHAHDWVDGVRGPGIPL